MYTARRHVTHAFIAVMTLAAAACARGPAGGGTEVGVRLRDFDIELSRSSAPAGAVTLDVTNQGPSTHEVEIFAVPDGVDADHLKVTAGVADTGGLRPVDEVEDIAPSTNTSLSVTLAPGTYVLICNLPGHYQQGMHVTFVAGQSSGP